MTITDGEILLARVEQYWPRFSFTADQAAALMAGMFRRNSVIEVCEACHDQFANNPDETKPVWRDIQRRLIEKANKQRASGDAYADYVRGRFRASPDYKKSRLLQELVKASVEGQLSIDALECWGECLNAARAYVQYRGEFGSVWPSSGDQLTREIDALMREASTGFDDRLRDQLLRRVDDKRAAHPKRLKDLKNIRGRVEGLKPCGPASDREKRCLQNAVNEDAFAGNVRDEVFGVPDGVGDAPF